ncbi:cortical protein KAR9-domain-containing protein [Podospora appendiculata]|uniref:Cortical protein KAR9-domain-containing protein n=1 Tax=Podospora appendiculata TaxID=314037 RepID=A0AAE0XKW3_9PEZI|nr:cortical protein KAR9-domain-containing protein [Podospora appendiculata]
MLTVSNISSELLQRKSPVDSPNTDTDYRQQHQYQQRHHLRLNRDANINPRDADQHIPSTTSPHQHPQLLANDSSSTAAPAASTPIHHPRRPSPGLAARLKALGFGSTRKSSSPPPSQLLEPVGRLPEEKLRKLDQGHQGVAPPPVIERRGRPWKGVVRISSRSSLKSNKSLGKQSEADEIANEVADCEARPDFLPEIATSKPLEMDTNKYRLPDHINGNGVKVQRETREEHLARDTRPPQSPPGDAPPPPPPKDSPPLSHRAGHTPSSSDDFNPNAVSYFNPLGLQRPGSVYTLSRASFADQLAQLTSIQLPDAESLSSKVSAIPTAQAATRALIGAAEQIRGWIYKASEVIGGLEGDDDVQWAAAGGREGVEEVENAILRFEELINIYVSAIEELQGRDDIAQVSTDDLRRAVAQMEAILDEWAKIRTTLHNVKEQVEIAMEWEELWNMVLGDIQNEMDDLSRLVFEMEERRHKSILTGTPEDGVDIGDLESIVDDTPPSTSSRVHAVNSRFSLPPFPVSPSSPSHGASMSISYDDSSLLALFARMQPLRASLYFLPMRLSVFEARAEGIFPTACEELEMRRAGLDGKYKKLEKDAESLRKELGEDRWVLVFRGAGRQAQKMYESVERGAARLKEAIDAGMHLTNQPMMSKTIENYEAKKTHYGPAIERVLSIIDKGVKDRLTVNGEILRLHTEMQAKWQELRERMADLDMAMEEIQADKKGQQLRDSVSSMLSNDRSTIGSGHETPQTSPPSSVIMSGLGAGNLSNGQSSQHRSPSVESRPSQTSNRRRSLLPTSSTYVQRKPPTPRFSTLSAPSREGSITPTGDRISRPGSTLGNRPRWNTSTNTAGIDTGHNFKPLSLTTPSPYAKTPPSAVRSVSALTPGSASKLPMLRSPLARAASSSPIPEDTPSKNMNTPRLSSFRERLSSSGSSSQQQTLPKPRLAAQASMSSLNTRRASFHPPRPVAESSNVTPRSVSSMAASRRTSLLPKPKNTITGRESPQAVAGARFAMRNETSSTSKPKWRG